MKRTAIAIIRDEHRSFRAVVRGMQFLAREVGAGRMQPRLDALHAMAHYVQNFPERFHHPKEDAYLFRLLRRRRPDVAPLLDVLTAEHRRSKELIDGLARSLGALESSSPPPFVEFVRAVDAYAEFHADHIQREEEEVIPLAESALEPADWLVIDAAFCGHTDPMLGAAAEAEFGRLIKRIVALAPPPIGVGRQ